MKAQELSHVNVDALKDCCYEKKIQIRILMHLQMQRDV